MTREQKILATAAPILEELVKTSFGWISEEVKKNKEKILSELLKILNTLGEASMHLQCDGKKGDAEYLCIEYLLSSAITKSYDFQISIYDENFHLDSANCATYWSSLIMFDRVDDDMEVLFNNIANKFMELKRYELDEIRRAYISLFHNKLIGLFLIENIKDIVLKSNIPLLNTHGAIQVLYGGFMDQMILIDKIEREDVI